jgi:hypothetical protein
MVANDDFDGKASHLNCFYMHMNFEQKYPKLAIVGSCVCKSHANTGQSKIIFNNDTYTRFS